MINPFEVIVARLETIENLLLDIKHQKLEAKKQAEYFTVKEVAKFLDLTVPTIYSKVNRGQLPYLKRGKRLYFSRETIENWLNNTDQKQQKNEHIQSK